MCDDVVDPFAIMADMCKDVVVKSDCDITVAQSSDVADLATERGSDHYLQSDQDEHAETASLTRKPAPWEQYGTTSALVDSLSRQIYRLRLWAFELPWVCGTCASTNCCRFGSCEVCTAVNERYVNAILADIAESSQLRRRDEEDHVLLVMARGRTSREIEACFVLCEAFQHEKDDPCESSLLYRRAFKLWPELDSDICLDGVPMKLRMEADAILATRISTENAQSSTEPQGSTEEAISCARLKPKALPKKLAAETSVDFFMGSSELEIAQVFKGDRFPNVVVTLKGTILIVWGLRRVQIRRSEDGGKTWGQVITIADGIHCGGVTVDEFTGRILVFVEDFHPPAPLRVYQSMDDGHSWASWNLVLNPDSAGRVPAMHMNEHGITLHRGPHRGRLLRTSRWYAGGDDIFEFPRQFTSAVFSDDRGSTWNASEPLPAMGAGEAAVVELEDGSIYYNFRRHWAPHGRNAGRRRWSARSNDGGATWTDVLAVNDLPDGPQQDDFGLFGGLVRLPVQGQDILIFSNCDSVEDRERGTIWLSWDGGQTWPIKRLLFEHEFAYSALAAGRVGTASQGWIYCFFEGPDQSGHVARFNLSWLSDLACGKTSSVAAAAGTSAGSD